jgi:hypothetical protein
MTTRRKKAVGISRKLPNMKEVVGGETIIDMRTTKTKTPEGGTGI